MRGGGGFGRMAAPGVQALKQGGKGGRTAGWEGRGRGHPAVIAPRARGHKWFFVRNPGRLRLIQ